MAWNICKTTKLDVKLHGKSVVLVKGPANLVSVMQSKNAWRKVGLITFNANNAKVPSNSLNFFSCIGSSASHVQTTTFWGR